MKKNEEQRPTFEATMARLEEIVSRLENGGAGLDESLAIFEEGVALVRQCNEILTQAEQKVKILVSQGEGDMAEEPFAVPPVSAEGKV